MCIKKPSTTNTITTTPRHSSTHPSTTTTTTTTSSSLSTLHDHLPQSPILFPPSEIRLSTRNFRSPPHSPSSFLCTLRSISCILFRRPFHSLTPSLLPSKLSSLSRCHHSSLVPLLGASLLSPNSLAIVYPFLPLSPLPLLLNNPNNPSFTVLSTWTSRVKIAADVAAGVEYVHLHGGEWKVHGKIKASAVLVSEEGFRAKIAHFGAAELSGEKERRGSDRRIEGTRGYIAPEVLKGGRPEQKSDVFAFGVVLLEILTGERPMRYKYDGDVVESISLIDTAKDVMAAEEGEERQHRLRRWIDRRLGDSFPVEVAEKAVAVGLECVEEEPARRPDMVRVSARVSSLLLETEEWSEKFRVPVDISVSMAPR